MSRAKKAVMRTLGKTSLGGGEGTSALVSELEKIRAACGGVLTPDAVVEAAKDPLHPLHGRFEWDDAKAAHQHRLWQARVLIHGATIKVVRDEREVRVPVYLSDPRVPHNEQGYRPTTEIRRVEDEARVAMRRELTSAASAIERARNVADALDMVEELDALLAQIVLVRDKISPPVYAPPAAAQPEVSA